MITSITYYAKANSGTVDCACAIYSDDSGAPDVLLAQDKGNQTIDTTAQWVTININCPIVSGQSYWLFKWASASSYVYWDTGDTNQYNIQGATFETWPNPITPGTYFDRKVSIYATYTTNPTGTANDTNKYVSFDGVDGYVEVADEDTFSIPTTGELTASFWVKRSVDLFTNTEDDGDNGTYVMFLGKGGYHETNNLEWGFRYYSDDGDRPNHISFYMFDLDGGSGAGGRITDPPATNEWCHIVGRVNNPYISIFKNGVKADQENWVTCPITPENGDEAMRFGTMTKTGFFEGSLDDVKIFNRALEDIEIQNLYNAGRGGIASSYSLVGRWKFDGNYEDEIADRDGTGYGGVSLTSDVADSDFFRLFN